SRRLIIAVSFTSAVARLGTCCLCVSLTYFFFKCYAVPRDQHSFPTRRSSDLIRPVLLLRAKPASLDDDDAVLGGALPRELERARSEEHTSELQSRENLVCRLLLEKKNESDEQIKVLCKKHFPQDRIAVPDHYL